MIVGSTHTNGSHPSTPAISSNASSWRRNVAAIALASGKSQVRCGRWERCTWSPHELLTLSLNPPFRKTWKTSKISHSQSLSPSIHHETTSTASTYQPKKRQSASFFQLSGAYDSYVANVRHVAGNPSSGFGSCLIETSITTDHFSGTPPDLPGTTYVRFEVHLIVPDNRFKPDARLKFKSDAGVEDVEKEEVIIDMIVR